MKLSLNLGRFPSHRSTVGCRPQSQYSGRVRSMTPLGQSQLSTPWHRQPATKWKAQELARPLLFPTAKEPGRKNCYAAPVLWKASRRRCVVKSTPAQNLSEIAWIKSSEEGVP